ncbi:hypothetical protein Golax_023452 [Gossypium laxum]|uniref:Uncharacterized protein n=1 Tax=Gossypium laxum TaxID=34288 RepID=A0A7J9B3L1_9ROSI|nr:hypothetical protein [Gossypium laxum]
MGLWVWLIQTPMFLLRRILFLPRHQPQFLLGSTFKGLVDHLR